MQQWEKGFFFTLARSYWIAIAWTVIEFLLKHKTFPRPFDRPFESPFCCIAHKRAKHSLAHRILMKFLSEASWVAFLNGAEEKVQNVHSAEDHTHIFHRHKTRIFREECDLIKLFSNNSRFFSAALCSCVEVNWTALLMKLFVYSSCIIVA